MCNAKKFKMSQVYKKKTNKYLKTFLKHRNVLFKNFITNVYNHFKT